MMKNSKGKIAISQVLILVVSIVAFTYMAAQTLPVVSAFGGCVEDSDCGSGETCVSGQCIESVADYDGSDFSTGAIPTNNINPCADVICEPSSQKYCLDGVCKDYTFDEGYTYEYEDESGNLNVAQVPDEVADPNGDGDTSDNTLKTYVTSALGIVGTISKISGYLKKGGNILSKLTSKGEIVDATTTTSDALSTTTTTTASEGSLDTALFEGSFLDFFLGTDTVIGSGTYILGTVAVAGIAAFGYTALFKYAIDTSARNLRDITNIAYGTAGVVAVAAIAGTYLGVFGTTTAAAAAAGAAAAGSSSIFLTSVGLAGGASTAGPAGWVVAVIVIVVAAVLTLFSWQNYSRESYTYIVSAWKAPEGGEYCSLCNDLRYGCSEYQCSTFGTACEIVNEGTDQESCVWINEDDTTPPTISQLDGILKEDYVYNPFEVESPPARGIRIKYQGSDADENGCIPAYTGLTLGVETNELSWCKIDTARQESFDDMIVSMAEGTIYVTNHTMPIPHAATASAESVEAQGFEATNGNELRFYVRCEDKNGNANAIDFLIEFCVEDGPDTKAPVIETSYAQETYIQYNKTSVDGFEVYTNEPAECRWDFEDLDYDNMNYGLEGCSQTDSDYLYPTKFVYGCTGTLSGIKLEEETDYYIRCKDKPWWTEEMKGKRYANEESYVLTLIGTEPLLINKVTIDGKGDGAIVKDSTDMIKAELKVATTAGAERGKAECYYTVGGTTNKFYNDGVSGFLQTNTQNLYLAEGDYNVGITCYDKAGNIAEDSIEFSVDVDTDAPTVVRAYYENNYLRLITNEDAECVYTSNENVGCNYEYDDGTPMTSQNTKHFTKWEVNNKYYIKCKDDFGNLPDKQNECSIVVKSFEDYQNGE